MPQSSDRYYVKTSPYTTMTAERTGSWGQCRQKSPIMQSQTHKCAELLKRLPDYMTVSLQRVGHISTKHPGYLTRLCFCVFQWNLITGEPATKCYSDQYLLKSCSLNAIVLLVAILEFQQSLVHVLPHIVCQQPTTNTMISPGKWIFARLLDYR